MAFHEDSIKVTLHQRRAASGFAVYREGAASSSKRASAFSASSPMTYHESEFSTLPLGKVRLILYSDGAFDVFNKSGKILGQKKFFDWVESSLDKDRTRPAGILCASESKDIPRRVRKVMIWRSLSLRPTSAEIQS
jgi:hypothetical protein